MKKLLSILSSLGLVTTASAGVTACGSTSNKNSKAPEVKAIPEFKSISYSESNGELSLQGKNLDVVEYNNLSLESDNLDYPLGVTITKSDKSSLTIKLSAPLKFYGTYTLTYTASDLSSSKSINFDYSGTDAQIYSANINELGNTISIYGANLSSITKDEDVKVSYSSDATNQDSKAYLSGLSIDKANSKENCLIIKSASPIAFNNYEVSIGEKDTQKYELNYVSDIKVMAADYKPYDEKDVELFLHGNKLDLIDDKNSTFEIKAISDKAVVPDGEQITIKMNSSEHNLILQLSAPLEPTAMPEGEEDESLVFELTIKVNGREVSKIQFDAKTEIQNPGGNTAPDDENPENPDNPPFNPNN